jgi:flagellar motor switch protein FliG
MKPMTGLEKVALLLKGLGPKATDTILAQLGPGHAERVRARIQQLPPGPEQQQAITQLLKDVAQAFSEDPGAKARAVKAGTDAPVPARPAGINLLVQEDAEGEEETADTDLPSDPLEAVRRLPPAQLARAMLGENPRTVSLLLNHLDTPQAGEVYKRLAATMRRDVSFYFASQTMPPLEVLRRVAQGIVQKSRSLADAPAQADPNDRVKKMAELIRLLERAERTELLAALAERDSDMAQKVKDLLYQFEDLLQIESSSVQKLLGELDTKTLATALQGATPAIQHKILSNLSKRAQDALQEEIDLMGSVPKSKVELARKAIVEVIRRLDERGELIMTESP